MQYVYFAFSKFFTHFAQLKNCTQDQARSDPTCQTTLPPTPADAAHFKLILQYALGIIAAATVVYIVLSGLKFVASQGEPEKVAKARNSIIFACIGLAIVLSADIIVTFVLKSL